MKAVYMLNSKTRRVEKSFDSVKEAATYVVETLGYKRKVGSVAQEISKICDRAVIKRNYYGHGWAWKK